MQPICYFVPMTGDRVVVLSRAMVWVEHTRLFGMVPAVDDAMVAQRMVWPRLSEPLPRLELRPLDHRAATSLGMPLRRRRAPALSLSAVVLQCRDAAFR
jgi:hypothetical protein